MTILLGAVGATIILIAFVALQLHKLKQSDLNYHLLNLIGSIILIMYDILLESLPFLTLNTIWGISALFGVIKIIKTYKNLSLKNHLSSKTS